MISICPTESSPAFLFSFSAFAHYGSWQYNSEYGCWWLREDGVFPDRGWYWVDGNADGFAECYYFDERGYILTDTTTPDGYTVDANGAWTENDTVQQKAADPNTDDVSRSEALAADPADTENAGQGYTYKTTLWLMGEGLETGLPSDYYTAQLFMNDEWYDLYDPTGTVRYTRENKPEWVPYEENMTECAITGAMICAFSFTALANGSWQLDASGAWVLDGTVQQRASIPEIDEIAMAQIGDGAAGEGAVTDGKSVAQITLNRELADLIRKPGSIDNFPDRTQITSYVNNENFPRYSINYRGNE